MKNYKQRKDLTDLHLRKIILADIWKIQGKGEKLGSNEDSTTKSRTQVPRTLYWSEFSRETESVEYNLQLAS